MANKKKRKKSTSKKSYYKTSKNTNAKNNYNQNKNTKNKNIGKKIVTNEVEKIEVKTEQKPVVKKTEEKKFVPNSFLCFSIALFLVIALIAYAKFSFEFSNRNYKSNVNTNDLPTSAKEKYSFLSSKRNLYDNSYIFFTNGRVDNTNVDSKSILTIAYQMLAKEDKKEVGQAKENCYISKNVTKENYPDGCYMEIFDKALIEEQINNYFYGININYDEFNATVNTTCYLKENKYYCYLHRNFFKVSNYSTVNDYETYEFKDNKLYVYSYLLTIRKSNDRNYPNGIYKDSMATIQIDNLDYFKNELKETINTETTKTLINKYKDQITRYKSTFEYKDENFLWVSTEII